MTTGNATITPISWNGTSVIRVHVCIMCSPIHSKRLHYTAVIDCHNAAVIQLNYVPNSRLWFQVLKLAGTLHCTSSVAQLRHEPNDFIRFSWHSRRRYNRRYFYRTYNIAATPYLTCDRPITSNCRHWHAYTTSIMAYDGSCPHKLTGSVVSRPHETKTKTRKRKLKQQTVQHKNREIFKQF